jgi:hypothetical protein
MSWAAAVVIIVAIWGLVTILRSGTTWARGSASDEEDNLIGNPQRERELEAEIAQLRERVHVLERIATDANSNQERESRRLSAEIDSLRSPD